MKQTITIIFLLIILPAVVNAQKDWVLIKNSDNIQVFTRDIHGSLIKELKVITQFSSTMDAIVNLLTDISAHSKFQYGCIDAKRINKSSNYEQIYYQLLYMPWPFMNRDGVFKQTIKPQSTPQEVFIETYGFPDFLPVEKNLVRVPYMHSTWHLKSINGEKVNGEYTVSVDPGGNVPAWLINLFIDKAPMESVIRIRKLLKEDTYSKKSFEWMNQRNK